MSTPKKKILALILVLAFLIPTFLLLWDSDGDGLSNVDEYRIGTDPGNPDTDADGLNDFEEVHKGRDGYITNPLSQDSDSDGLSDYDEVNRYGTDPNLLDTDGEGLSDYEEVYEGQDGYITDPLKEDTDSDGLSDYEEISEFQTKPLKSDSDIDGLSDYLEVYEFGTNPNLLDTDDDRLSDYEEVYEAEDGYETNPLDSDSDSDGLSDYDEVYEFGTNPNLLDTDGDGARDSIDLMPNGYPDIVWRERFDPGLIRLTFDFNVYGVQGLYAQKWVYHWFPGICRFLADHTAGSTRSSNINRETVIESVNSALENADRGAFKAVDAEYLRDRSYQFLRREYGHCDHFSPKYKIGYVVVGEVYQVPIMNHEPTVVEDSQGVPYWFTVLEIPVELNIDQTISLQFHLNGDQTGSSFPSGEVKEVPGFAFHIYRNRQFKEHESVHQSTVPGIHMGDDVYQVDLNLGAGLVSSGNVSFGEGKPTMTLVTTPVWIDILEGRIRTLEPSSFNMVAVNHRHVSEAFTVVVRQGLSVSEVEKIIPENISSYAPGHYQFGPYEVCLTNFLNASYCHRPTSEDAIVIVSNSIAKVEEMKADIDWGSQGVWFKEQRDEWGDVLRTFSDLLDVIEIDLQLFGLWSTTQPDVSSTKVQLTEITLTLVQIRLGSAGQKEYNSYQGEIQKETDWENDVGAKRTFVHWRIRSIEIVQNPEDSGVSKRLGNYLTQSLKLAKIGTILVSNGREAWLAHLDGDTIQGSLYAAKGGVDTLSVLVEDRTLGSLGVGIKVLEKVPAAKLAKIVLGILTNGYATSKIGGASSEFERRILIDQTYTSTLDFVFSMVLGLRAFYLGWSIGVTIAYTIIPNDLAAKIMSSPISFLGFIWTSFFTDEIPLEIAEDALEYAIRMAVESAKYANESGRPAVVVLP